MSAFQDDADHEIVDRRYCSQDVHFINLTSYEFFAIRPCHIASLVIILRLQHVVRHSAYVEAPIGVRNGLLLLTCCCKWSSDVSRTEWTAIYTSSHVSEAFIDSIQSPVHKKQGNTIRLATKKVYGTHRRLSAAEIYFRKPDVRTE